MKLSIEVVSFLKNEMCIDVDDFIARINDPSIGIWSEYLYKSVSAFFDALSGDQAEDKIQDVFMSFELLKSNPAAYSILDTLRYAFDGFAYGGLHQLYTRQENQGWFPKIKLICELKPNDIESLDELVRIYRGCSSAEYQLKSYGQAWSTSKAVAENFAYEHYQRQPWFVKDERLVLKAVIAKSSIFYSKQSDEFEVAVNTEYLHNVEICT